MEKEAIKSESKVEKNSGVDKTVEQGHLMSDWFIFRENRHFGPLTSKQIKTCLKDELITKEHYIWRHGFDSWKKIRDVDSFAAYGVLKSDFNLSDKDFSEKANIQNIDRIALEDKELNFSNEEVQGSLALEKYEKFFAEYKKYTPLLVVLIAVSLYFVFKSPERGMSFRNLSSVEKTRLLSTSNIPESIDQVAFNAYKSHMVDPREPVFVSATNLPKGARLKYFVSGVPGTLLGAHRYEKEFEEIVEKKIFTSQPLRAITGEYIPEGLYKVSVLCLSCTNNEYIFKRDFEILSQDKGAYKAGLKSYHQDMRKSAKLELDELYDMAVTLKQQYQRTANNFVKTKTKGSKRNWENFSKTWLADQQKLISLFEQIKNPKFRESLYYLSLYEKFGDLTGQIFELHVLQDSMVSEGKADSAKLQNATQIAQNINLTLEFLKSQVDLMNVNYNQSKLLPPKTGLIEKMNGEGV